MRQLVGSRAGRRLVGSFHGETEDSPDSQLVDGIEAEERKRPLDRGSFGIGDPFERTHLDDRCELHADTPHQSEKDRPLICS